MSIGDSPVGQLVPISGFDPRTQQEYRHVAYLPDPLPESASFSNNTWLAISSAMHALGRLDHAVAGMPNPRLLARPAIRREAVSTSALEGTFAAFTDVLAADVTEGPQTPEVVEVRNYITAAEYAFYGVAHDRPISVGLTCELQDQLIRGTDKEAPDTGRLRDRQVFIGRGPSITDARYVPPPPGDLLEGAMRSWEAWVNSTNDFAPLAHAALAHYQFESLHPFHDGNGRIGRLIVVMQLLRSSVLSHPLLAISPWLEGQRQQYQDLLLRVSETGDFDSWVQFFCAAVSAQALRTVDQIVELTAYVADVRRRLTDARVTGTAAKLLDDIVGRPVVTVRWMAEQYGVTFAAANTAVGRLVDLGVLSELTGRKQARAFGALQILRIIES